MPRRTLRFVYGGTATRLPAEDKVALLVTGALDLRGQPTRILNGQSVVFSGRVQGRPLPEAGKLIELQVRLSEEWSTFRTIRSKARRELAHSYPFKRTCGAGAFPLPRRASRRGQLSAGAGAQPRTCGHRERAAMLSGIANVSEPKEEPAC